MWAAVSDLPLFVTNAYLLSFHEWLRARYYKKAAREAAGGSGAGGKKRASVGSPCRAIAVS